MNRPVTPPLGALVVRHTGRTGLGVFTRARISAGAAALVVAGPERVWRSVSEEDAAANPDWIGIGKDRWIASAGLARFLNHACAPNTYLWEKRVLVARRDIQAGEELTFDYALTEDEVLWQMPCACGGPTCRGFVRPVQFLTTHERAAAEPYLQPHFREVWEAAHTKASVPGEH